MDGGEGKDMGSVSGKLDEDKNNVEKCQQTHMNVVNCCDLIKILIKWQDWYALVRFLRSLCKTIVALSPSFGKVMLHL